MKSLQDIQHDKKEVLIQLQDSAVIEIYEDEIYERGCETCDYGSSYGINYTFEFEDGERFNFDFADEYSSPVSEGDIMKFILNNLDELSVKTKEEFKAIISNEEIVLGC